MSIKVKAMQTGYYGSLREPGDEFVIVKAEDFSGEWMEKIPTAKGERPSKEPEKTDPNGGKS